jgi:glycosyltransferase involved in cell wall biosynthesis
MKIALVLYEYDVRVRGGMGGHRHPVELAEAWTRAGHETVIVRPRLGAGDERAGVRVVETPIVEAPLLRPLSAYAGLTVGGLRAARRLGADVIYAREMLGPAPLVVARLLRRPLVVEVNGDAYQHRRDVLGNGALRLASVRALQRLTFRRADRIVTVTPGLRARLLERFALSPERVVVVENGTNLVRLAPLDPAASRRALALDPGAPHVGFVGTFFHYQGIATLVAAAPEILRHAPATRFLVVGDGPARGEWEDAARRARVAHAFVFPGQVPHASVGQWISAMDVCVAPFTASRGETSPLKLYDYLACARPVVVSAIEAVTHESRASGGCVDVPPDDPAALAGAVTRLLDDPGWRRRLGEAGRDWVTRERSWDAVARRVLEVCGDAIRARRT